jgi:DNA sulfur modification protein DndC
MDEHLPLDADDVALLRELAGDDRLHFELVRELLDVEQRHRAMTRRAGLFDALEGAMRRGFYTDADDATGRALRRRDVRQSQPVEDDATALFDVDPIFAREAPAPIPDGTRQP